MDRLSIRRILEYRCDEPRFRDPGGNMRGSIHRRLTVILSTGVMLLAVAATAEDQPVGSNASRGWPQFLGPDRNGISQETGLIKTWPKEGPKEVWRVPGGEGMSGLAVSG